MDWQKFINDLLAAKNKFLADANTALKPLPPIEQHEASSVVGFAIRELNSCFQWITTTCMRMDSDLQDLIARGNEIIADQNKKYVAEQVSAGELIPKSKIEAGDYLTKEVAQQNCQAAAEKAANDREIEVVERLQLLASRRTELYTPTVGADGKEVPALLSREIVEKLPDDLLKGENYLENIKIITGRVGEVQALGVNVPKLLARAYELPLDDAGSAQFADQLSMIKDAAGDPKPPKSGGAAANAPLAMRTANAGEQSHELEGVF